MVLQGMFSKPGMIAYTCNPRIWEAEAEGSLPQLRPCPKNEKISKKTGPGELWREQVSLCRDDSLSTSSPIYLCVYWGLRELCMLLRWRLEDSFFSFHYVAPGDLT